MEKKKQTSTEKTRIHKGLIGTSSTAEQEHIVCTPDKLRKRHIIVIGKPSMGMSTYMKNMIMYDIKNGHGVDISSVAGQEHIVCTPDKPRKRHVHFIGKPSMGMSTLMRDIILGGIKNGHNIGVIDSHDDMAKRILDACPPSSQNDQAAK